MLIVDDNRDAALLLHDLLQSQGYEVRVAFDGADAVGVARRFRPDIAVLDIGLPVMDGYELAGRLREALGTGVRLVALTGYGQQSDQRRAAEAGFDRHLVKPVDPATIGRVLEEVGAAG